MPKSHRDRPATNRFDPVVQELMVSEPPPEPEAPEPEAPPPPPQMVVDSSPPPRQADKAEWVAYAESIGIDASGTKTEIVGRVRNG